MKRKSILILAIFVILSLFIIFLPTNFLIIKPGSAENLKQFVTIDNIENGEDEGIFYLLTVAQHKATTLWLIYGLFNQNIDILPVNEVIPPGLKEEDYRIILERWMEESQLLAKLIALRRTGYGDDILINGGGIAVKGFIENSPSEGNLLIDDIILSVDGEEVYFADQMIALIQDRKIGEMVELKVNRDEEVFTLTIPTVEHVRDPEKAALGIYITAMGNWDLDLPFDIDIKTGEISGPSAGVMFVLEIINQLLPGDIAGGHKIAGTGTINYFEEIGAIGGVKQKVAAAEKVGAEYFIVPEENYSDALTVAKTINLIPVKNLQDVIDFLYSINMAYSYESWFSSLEEEKNAS